MVQDVYIDILFLINFSMDYICLYICSKVLHRRMSPTRMILASILGGAWSAVSLFLPLSSMWELICDCTVGLLMCVAVYAERGRGLISLLSSSLLFVGISMMMGGSMTAIFNFLNKLELPISALAPDSISTYLFAILAAAGGVISLKSGQVISQRSNIKECRLTVIFCGVELQFSGFSDSGNLVRDPLSGKAIIFVDRSVIEKKLSLGFLDRFLQGELDADAPCKELRLISLKTAAGASLSVAARPESICASFENKRGRTVSANIDALISPAYIGNGAQGHTAIVPAEILKE